jgi:hypothetical protein
LQSRSSPFSPGSQFFSPPSLLSSPSWRLRTHTAQPWVRQ